MANQRISYYHPNLQCNRTWVPMFIQILSMIRNNCYLIYSRHHLSLNQKRGVLNHKQFTLAMIDSLLHEAKYYNKNPNEVSNMDVSTPSPSKRILIVTSAGNTSSTTRGSKRRRILDTATSTSGHYSNTAGIYSTIMVGDNTLSPLTFNSSRLSCTQTSSLQQKGRFDFEKHKRIKATSTNKRLQKACQYCSELYELKKKNIDASNDLALKWDKEVSRTGFICSECNVFLCAQHFIPYHQASRKS